MIACMVILHAEANTVCGQAPTNVCLTSCSGSALVSSFAVTNPENAFLAATDGTAVSFWIFSTAMGKLRRGTNECVVVEAL